MLCLLTIREHDCAVRVVATNRKRGLITGIEIRAKGDYILNSVGPFNVWGKTGSITLHGTGRDSAVEEGSCLSKPTYRRAQLVEDEFI